MTTPKITPLQYISTILGLLMFILFGTNVFEGINDWWLILIYGTFTVIGILFNMNATFKQMAIGIRDIWLDRTLSAEQKVTRIGNEILKGLFIFGAAWEELNEEQGTSPQKQT